MQYSKAANFFYVYLWVLAVWFITGCNAARKLPEGQSLLLKNKFVLEGKLTAAEKDKLRTDLPGIAAQKPNKRLFGFMPVRMWMYQSALKKKKLNRFNQWILDKVGEPPVLFDSTLTDRSERAMENYMFNFGYFYADIQDTFITQKKRTTVIYRLKPGPVWKIGEVSFSARRFVTDSVLLRSKKPSVLKKGERFDIATLKAERERIESILRNEGFFYFNREYVTFDLDTNGTNHTVNVRTSISQPSDTAPHLQYRINNIYVTTDFIADRFNDTLQRTQTIAGDSSEFVVSYSRRILRDPVLIDALYFKRGDLYKRDNETRTINRFVQLGIFRFISVDFLKAKDRSGNYIDAFVSLTPAKRQAISAGFDLSITNEGFFGTSGSFSYRNKNLSKRADQFVFDIGAGSQVRFSRARKVELITSNINLSFTYYLNRMVGFSRAKAFSRNRNPRTRFNLGYNFEYRYDFNQDANVTFLYQLHNFSLNYGYEWIRNRSISHLLNPVAANFFLLPEKGQEFINRLDANPALESAFEEQVTISQFYAFTYNGQKSEKDRAYTYFRGSAEGAGNLLYGMFKLANLGKSANDSVYRIATRPFSQFFRFEADWRNYVRIRNNAMFAVRTYAGIGVPFGNSAAMPFIKQFFVGGPNSLRGFLIREVGPGGYADSLIYNPETGEKRSIGFFNQTGDIKLEMNMELRFTIYKWLKAAVFADAGNVWTIRRDTRTLGEFDFNRFWKEFAVDAGAGIRLDFNFFVIRFDYGFPLRDPRRSEDKRWQFKDAQAFKIGQFQLAIGYPF